MAQSDFVSGLFVRDDDEEGYLVATSRGSWSGSIARLSQTMRRTSHFRSMARQSRFL